MIATTANPRPPLVSQGQIVQSDVDPVHLSSPAKSDRQGFLPLFNVAQVTAELASPFLLPASPSTDLG